MGSFARMKTAMVSHVETERYNMFRQATNAAQGRLDDMCATVESQMRARIQDIFTTIYRDYMTVLVGVSANNLQQRMGREERELRTKIASILAPVDLQFAFIDPNEGPAWAADGAADPGTPDEPQRGLPSDIDERSVFNDGDEECDESTARPGNDFEPARAIKDENDGAASRSLPVAKQESDDLPRAPESYDDTDDDDADIPSFEDVFGLRNQS